MSADKSSSIFYQFFLEITSYTSIQYCFSLVSILIYSQVRSTDGCFYTSYTPTHNTVLHWKYYTTHSQFQWLATTTHSQRMMPKLISHWTESSIVQPLQCWQGSSSTDITLCTRRSVQSFLCEWYDVVDRENRWQVFRFSKAKNGWGGVMSPLERVASWAHTSVNGIIGCRL